MVIIVVARILGALFRWLNLPQVMGEVVAGILLGPSFLGWLAPEVASRILPVNTAPYLALLSQVGVVLYMFLVGLDLDTELLQERTQAAVAISHASIVLPFCRGQPSHSGSIPDIPPARSPSPPLLFSSA